MYPHTHTHTHTPTHPHTYTHTHTRTHTHTHTPTHIHIHTHTQTHTHTQPNKQLDRAWAVLHQFSSKGPFISFYQDNRRETRVMKREKIDLFYTKAITRMMDHPKHPHCFALKFKGSKCLLLNVDTE